MMTKNCVLDLTKPVQTRDGRKVEILRTPKFLIIAFIEDETNPSKWVLRTFHENGNFLDGYESGEDLFNIPPAKVRKEGWVNIYPVKEPRRKDLIAHQSGVFKTKQLAEGAAKRGNERYTPWPVCTTKIEWEEEL